MQLGLSLPQGTAPAYGSAGSPVPPPLEAPKQLVIGGGVLTAKPLGVTLALDAAADAKRAEAERLAQSQNNPVVTNLAGLIRKHWQQAKDAKQDVERKMLDAVRSRRGEYPPEKLTQIRKSGGSEIYMLLFATKARQAKALLTDALIGAGTEKPWTLSPTPKPDLPPEQVTQIMQGVFEMVRQAEMAMQPMGVDQVREIMQDAKERAESQMMAMARIEAARAEVEIEDMLVEGGWLEALDQFLDDLTTFKTAFIKGPIVQQEPCLEWAPGPDGRSKPQVYFKNKMRWKRVDPFNIYPLAYATDTDSAPLIERHKLTGEELSSLREAPGYNKAAIDEVLRQHAQGGLHEWLSIDVEKPHAEGREIGATFANQADTIDALQYWGSVSGKMLREWGMTVDEVPDEGKFYQVEAWLIGTWVIKAVINPDPLGRRPYYSDGYSRIPGAFWHNSLYDMLEDCQNMCNAAARALANNLGIASGPQVDVAVDRLAAGAEITEMYPWKIWQTKSDPAGSTARAVNFFQPTSNAQELMAVYEKFSLMADEYSGIPRYMAGFNEGSGGAGRTASGMSMMIGNASKSIKQLISSIDMRVISLSVGRLYEQQIQFNPNMRGDLRIVARGATSLATREAAQVRRNEFLQFTANPFDMQIMGPEGRAAVLREVAKSLQMNTDDIVPPRSILRQRAIAMAQQAQQQPQPGGEQLMDGSPTTDHFSPVAA